MSETMKLSKISGQLNQIHLNIKIDEKTYDIGKAHCWLGLIQKGQRPTKWLKANSKGTKINFDYIKSSEEIEQCFDELEIYLRHINRKHGTDITLNRNGQ